MTPGHMDASTPTPSHRRIDTWMHKYMVGRTYEDYEDMYVWTEGRVDLWTHGRMGSLTHEHTDARTHVIKKNGVWKVRKPTRKKKRGKMKKKR